MSIKGKKPRPVNKRKKGHRDSRLIIIATEGSKTEELYFNIFRINKVQFKVIPSKAGRPSPEDIIENLKKFRNEYELETGYDELWLMIDKDRWPDKKLSRVCLEVNHLNAKTALRNPYFELWLLLHFTDVKFEATSCRDVTKRLRKTADGYSKTRIDEEKYLPKVIDAVNRAKELDAASSSADRWPQVVGTHVYKILENLNIS